MQSFLQYRSFGKHVEDQLKQDRARIGLQRSRSSQNGQSAAGIDQDIEKAAEELGPLDTADLANRLREANASRELNARGATSDARTPAPRQVTDKAKSDEDKDKDGENENELEEAEEEEEEAAPDGFNKEAGDNSNDDQLKTATESGKRPKKYEFDEERPPLSRLSTIRSTRSIQSLGTKLGWALTGIDVRDRTTNEGGDRDVQVFVVNYQGPDDPLNPHNWPLLKRWATTFMITWLAFIVGFAASVDSSAVPQASATFGVSAVTESLATGLFLAGFGVGALVSGPLSETVGRNPVYIVTLFLMMCFILGSALAPNIGGQLAMRFIAGLFGAAPLTTAGGSMSDMWNSLERVYVFPMFANAGFIGPIFGPVLGAYIASSHAVSWRWCEWVTLIWSGVILVALILFQPETYPGTLLKWKAAHLRRLTGDPRFVAPVEIREQTLTQRLLHSLYRPFVMTAQEPIIIVMSLYMTVVYIILFGFLDGYTFIYQNIHHTSQGVTGLCFLGIIVGLFVSSINIPIVYTWAKRDLKKIQEAGGKQLPPEFRLWFAMLGGSIAIPVSMFWMAWTSYSSISIWSPLVASVFFGYGILAVFLSVYQYIIDTYEVYAASALASLTLIRYVASGGAIVWGYPFYENLGVHWALTVLGCISLLLVPVPYLLFIYGPKIRSLSRYAPNK